MRVCAVKRKECFSPNSVEKDTAILLAVVEAVRNKGHEVTCVDEDSNLLKCYGKQADVTPLFDVWLSMGRSKSTLDVLKREQSLGAKVLNSAWGVETCQRNLLQHLMVENGIPVADGKGNDGYWVKRADMAAISHDDVVFAPTLEAVSETVERFAKRGITQTLVQPHIVGDVVKFYGVQGTGFFRIFYPGDDGQTKFGDETMNGVPHHYDFTTNSLQKDAESLSRLTQVPIYGGDCVVQPSGEYKIIDFNDWPSFSRCRHEAAQAIASLI